MSYKYLSLLRPVGPGTYPKYEDNKVLSVENFDDRSPVSTKGGKVFAWGIIEYEKKMTYADMRHYDLLLFEEPEKKGEKEDDKNSKRIRKSNGNKKRTH